MAYRILRYIWYHLGITGKIPVDYSYITCLFLAPVSHEFRTSFARVSLYIARQVRDMCETRAKHVRDGHTLYTLHPGLFYPSSLSLVFSVSKDSLKQKKRDHPFEIVSFIKISRVEVLFYSSYINSNGSFVTLFYFKFNFLAGF
jgi:hypothetical protein